MMVNHFERRDAPLGKPKLFRLAVSANKAEPHYTVYKCDGLLILLEEIDDAVTEEP